MRKNKKIKVIEELFIRGIIKDPINITDKDIKDIAFKNFKIQKSPYWQKNNLGMKSVYFILFLLLFEDSFRIDKKKRELRKAKDDFFHSNQWRRVRYFVFKRDKGKCVLCGRSYKNHGIILHCDHIIPISKNWDLRKDLSNLQTLCEDCNLGKLTDNTNWR